MFCIILQVFKKSSMKLNFLTELLQKPRTTVADNFE